MVFNFLLFYPRISMIFFTGVTRDIKKVQKPSFKEDSNLIGSHGRTKLLSKSLNLFLFNVVFQMLNFVIFRGGNYSSCSCGVQGLRNFPSIFLSKNIIRVGILLDF